MPSVDEYLHTSYHPDCDYVDGVIEQRNGGERDHSLLQIALGSFLFPRRKQWGIWPFSEQRVQVAKSCFRVPDLCAVSGGKPKEKVFTAPPLICIEILSEEDRLGRIEQRIDDYLAMGVPHVWLIDPESRRAWTCTPAGHLEVKDGWLQVPGSPIAIPLAGIFSVLD